MSSRVLIVDDKPAMVDLIVADLREIGYDAHGRHDADAALEALSHERFDVVLTDLRMPGRSGIELCRQLVQDHPEVPVILMTAFGSVDAAVEAMRAGAYDFVTKPFEIGRLKVTIDRAIAHERMRREVQSLRRDMQGDVAFEGLLGHSKPMLRIFDLIDRVAPTDAPVLIQGESGTGKELVARAIHNRSLRSGAPFVAVNCTAIPEHMLESELFGHEKGAFTGAVSSRVGLLRKAHRGTLLLDEIGDMPADLQPKLLRVLQEGRIRPVGSDTELPIDVRLVCATHQDLERAVQARRFRQDLFFRIAVIRFRMPPLRERGDDVLSLTQHFLEEAADRLGRDGSLELTARAEKHLLDYAWPGNVRELRNWVEHAAVICDGKVLDVDCFPKPFEVQDRIESSRAANDADHAEPEPAEPSTDTLESLADVEHRHVLRVLEAVGGNKSRAAKILGIDRKTLLARLSRYERRNGD